jgi:hypothetical protein
MELFTSTYVSFRVENVNIIVIRHAEGREGSGRKGAEWIGMV